MSVLYHSCALRWVPLFLSRKEEEAAKKKKQEQAAAEQKQALSCTLWQIEPVTINEDGAQI